MIVNFVSPIALHLGAEAPTNAVHTGDMARQFGELMRRTEGADLSTSTEPTGVADAIRQHDAQFRENQQHIASLKDSVHDGKLTPAEVDDRGNMLMMEMAASHYQFNACIYVAQNTKTGLQTLIKNQ